MPLIPAVLSEFATPPWRLAHLYPGRQLHVSGNCISETEFARHQRHGAERTLADLVHECTRRYVHAHELVTPRARLPKQLLNSQPADVTDLLVPWDHLCSVYRSLVFDPQIDLFTDQDQREFQRWGEFVRHHCFDFVTQSPDFTRCILRTAGLLDPIEGRPDTSLDTLFDDMIYNIERYYADDQA